MSNKSLAAQFAEFQKANGYAGKAPANVQEERSASEAAGVEFLADLTTANDGTEVGIVMTATRASGAKGSLRTKYVGEIEAPEGSNAQDTTALIYLPADMGETVEVAVLI